MSQYSGERILLVFMIRDYHLYPVLSEEVIKKLSHVAKDLLSHVGLIEWDSRCSRKNILLHGNSDELYEIITNKNMKDGQILFIHEDYDCKDAMADCVLQTGNTVESFQFSTKNKLIGFNITFSPVVTLCIHRR